MAAPSMSFLATHIRGFLTVLLSNSFLVKIFQMDTDNYG